MKHRSFADPYLFFFDEAREESYTACRVEQFQSEMHIQSPSVPDTVQPLRWRAGRWLRGAWT